LLSDELIMILANMATQRSAVITLSDDFGNITVENSLSQGTGRKRITWLIVPFLVLLLSVFLSFDKVQPVLNSTKTYLFGSEEIITFNRGNHFPQQYQRLVTRHGKAAFLQAATEDSTGVTKSPIADTEEKEPPFAREKKLLEKCLHNLQTLKQSLNIHSTFTRRNKQELFGRMQAFENYERKRRDERQKNDGYPNKHRTVARQTVNRIQ
jgi:hypothetical protein